MFLQVLSDTREVMLDLDADLAQMVRRADAREHQQLRRADGTTGTDHLAFGAIAFDLAVLDEFDADGALAFEDDALGEGARLDGDVATLLGCAQIGHCGGPAATVLDGHIHAADAFLLIAVHVLGVMIAGLLGSFDEGIKEDVGLRAGMDPEWTAIAAIFVAANLAGFGAAEIGENFLIGPTFAVFLEGPAVIIQGMAADIDHGIERR